MLLLLFIFLKKHCTYFNLCFYSWSVSVDLLTDAIVWDRCGLFSVFVCKSPLADIPPRTRRLADKARKVKSILSIWYNKMNNRIFF